MSAFDRLERQLLESVAERSRPTRLERLGGLPFRRVGSGAQPLLATLLAVVAALGLWAGQTPRGSSPAAGLSASVVQEACAPCQAFGGRLHGPPAASSLTGAGATPAGRTADRRGLSVVRWSEQELSASPGESLPSAG